MRQPKVSVGFDFHRITTQRSPDSLRVSPSTIGGDRHDGYQGENSCLRLTLLLSRKHLQTIGVYLTKLFGSNVRFRILRELGSTKGVACVAEIVYPDKFYGTRIGIPRGVLK